MTTTLSPQQFVDTWRYNERTERQASQSHFIDLCRLVGHPSPMEGAGPEFTFEAGATKATGGDGWADVWKRGFFAWEYKGPNRDLNAAFSQLLQYTHSLENPPLLVVSDMQTIRIHTNFNNSAKRVINLTLDDLLTAEGLDTLRALFYDPARLRAAQTTAQVTEQAAAHFAQLANLLRRGGADPHDVAQFLIRLLFCLFAEDTALLPGRLFTRMVQQAIHQPALFTRQLGALFTEMHTGGFFGTDLIRHIDGRLFEDADVLPLDAEGMRILASACDLDWASIEPSVLGTLFERSLDPDKRSQLGAHYTSRDDILLIVEPVLMAPLRRRWETVQAEAHALAADRDKARGATRTRHQTALEALLRAFGREVAAVQVLDPACGSGNFLYVAMHQLLDLWQEVSELSFTLGLTKFYPLEGDAPYPSQLHGIEVNTYAQELAQTTIWIGYLQWLREHGYGFPGDPVLKPLDAIVQMDAILAYDDASGVPTAFDPVWPAADVIIGNPPFLGGKRMRSELGDVYVDTLFALYEGRVAHEADLVCYWFERARELVAAGAVERAGLLATQGIRGGANRTVLERIKATGDIFWAQSDRDWVLDGANVHVSMVGFDNGSEPSRELDGERVEEIHADLTSAVNLTEAVVLAENAGLAYMGDTKGGSFDIAPDVAAGMLAAPVNTNGRPNRDVVVPWVNGQDLTRRSRGMWIVDFGVDMPMETAAQYEAPFQYVKEYVRPVRMTNNREVYRSRWWIHVEPRPAMRAALRGLSRYLATARVAKYRLFCWLDPATLADSATITIAREDDYFFGVLQARPHELWALRQGTQLEDRPRYTPTTTFETYPFPWPPGQEPGGVTADPQGVSAGNPNGVLTVAIADAARDLVAKRDAWLNPEGATEAELKKRTLTNLYNANPTWLQLAHRALDRAVLAAYGWPEALAEPSDEHDAEILRRLLALNGERARTE